MHLLCDADIDGPGHLYEDAYKALLKLDSPEGPRFHLLTAPVEATASSSAVPITSSPRNAAYNHASAPALPETFDLFAAHSTGENVPVFPYSFDLSTLPQSTDNLDLSSLLFNDPVGPAPYFASSSQSSDVGASRTPPGLSHSPVTLPGTPLRTPQTNGLLLPDFAAPQAVAPKGPHKQHETLYAVPKQLPTPKSGTSQRSGLMDRVLGAQEFSPTPPSRSSHIRISKPASALPTPPALRAQPVARGHAHSTPAAASAPIQLPVLPGPLVRPASQHPPAGACIATKRKREEEEDVQVPVKRTKPLELAVDSPPAVFSDVNAENNDLPPPSMGEFDFLSFLNLPAIGESAQDSSDSFNFDFFSTPLPVDGASFSSFFVG
ncbi:hypothetical protein EXIGLDRAFT_297935 [Exidia glandulosa HHB12029]|uniref:Uncharacterized protein n=1 Tax=Exidia glandulosa HHB12029 TaxID=1314781 RepID=A0A165DAS7_EXIGL|nr:hypothetical protein EXIGLDRAFT_297935 [Exidia glandulosa HHB12029]